MGEMADFALSTIDYSPPRTKARKHQPEKPKFSKVYKLVEIEQSEVIDSDLIVTIKQGAYGGFFIRVGGTEISGNADWWHNRDFVNKLEQDK